MKDHITKGINVRKKLDFLGVPGKKPKGKKGKKVKMVPSISLGVKYDNYRGIGTQLGLNAGLTVGDEIAGKDTKELNGDNAAKSSDTTKFIPKNGANFGLNLSSLDGASTNLNFSIIKNAVDKNDYSLSKSIGFSYNSRAGLQGMTLGTTFNNHFEGEKGLFMQGSASSFISFVGNTYTPTVDFPTKNDAYTIDLNFGGQIQPFFAGAGISGFYAKQKLAYNKVSKPAYGFLYSDQGKDDFHALMDFRGVFEVIDKAIVHHQLR